MVDTSLDAALTRSVRTLPLSNLDVDQLGKLDVAIDAEKVGLAGPSLEEELREKIIAELSEQFEQKLQSKILEHKKVSDQTIKVKLAELQDVMSAMERARSALELEIENASEVIASSANVLVMSLLKGLLGDAEKYAQFVSEYIAIAIESVKPIGKVTVSLSEADQKALSLLEPIDQAAEYILIDRSLKRSEALISFDGKLFRISLLDHLERLYRLIVARLSEQL